MKTRRNDPCPCASGKRYKKCCMIKQGDGPIQDLREDVHNLIDGRSFDSMEELQSFVEQYNDMDVKQRITLN